MIVLGSGCLFALFVDIPRGVGRELVGEARYVFLHAMGEKYAPQHVHLTNLYTQNARLRPISRSCNWSTMTCNNSEIKDQKER
jgi:hypothetical protein